MLKDIAIRDGMKTLTMACMEHVYEGITTVDELLRVAVVREWCIHKGEGEF